MTKKIIALILTLIFIVVSAAYIGVTTIDFNPFYFHMERPILAMRFLGLTMIIMFWDSFEILYGILTQKKAIVYEPINDNMVVPSKMNRFFATPRFAIEITLDILVRLGYYEKRYGVDHYVENGRSFIHAETENKLIACIESDYPTEFKADEIYPYYIKKEA